MLEEWKKTNCRKKLFLYSHLNGHFKIKTAVNYLKEKTLIYKLTLYVFIKLIGIGDSKNYFL